jgi:hypothetical protein
MLDAPFVMGALFFLTYAMYYVLRHHIVINPLLEITSRRFWWWWEECNANTLRKNEMINDDYIKNMKYKC